MCLLRDTLDHCSGVEPLDNIGSRFYLVDRDGLGTVELELHYATKGHALVLLVDMVGTL